MLGHVKGYTLLLIVSQSSPKHRNDYSLPVSDFIVQLTHQVDLYKFLKEVILKQLHGYTLKIEQVQQRVHHASQLPLLAAPLLLI